MISKVWRILLEILEVLQKFFTASCCPGLDSMDDDDEEEEEKLLQDDQHVTEEIKKSN